eukprot:c53284_g1_i1 orf=2-403(-)
MAGSSNFQVNITSVCNWNYAIGLHNAFPILGTETIRLQHLLHDLATTRRRLTSLLPDAVQKQKRATLGSGNLTRHAFHAKQSKYRKTQRNTGRASHNGRSTLKIQLKAQLGELNLLEKEGSLRFYLSSTIRQAV